MDAEQQDLGSVKSAFNFQFDHGNKETTGARLDT